ncbi:NACHT, LRR and PYD domains-containing protein 7 [Pipistrellus kuhlii]|uniref:NACHT, LRR and PYD domains-containing protein 7 n=1 Tax=Pipistrellus kuhlii TaxID=59472 RepID=UPI00174EF74E|nr:NACHT, LRR and PYD domains-containing protein 7 [Pipistrellus kuhlii]
MEKFCSIWKHTFWNGVGDDLHYKVIEGGQKFTGLPSLKTSSQRRLLTVVLQGAAGVGKTTLAKKWMLDWAQDHLPETFHSAFYLSCKELGRQGACACTFAELLAKKRPDAQEAGRQVLAQGQEVLVVVDGFDELRVPSGSLIHDICGDWKEPKPVPVLLGSLLKRKLLPKATLLVTTRPEALGELRLLLDQPLLVQVEGFQEAERRGYFLEHFEQQDQALRAFQGMKASPALFRMGAAPAVCWVACTCLKGQLDKGEDPASTCKTPTSLFLRFLCGQCPHLAAPAPRLPTGLRALSLLAAQGVWAHKSLFDGQDLGQLGVSEADLRPFLEGKVLQADADCEGCYAFLHLSVQQFLAALFYLLDGGAGGCGCGCAGQGIGDVRALLSKGERLRNPSLAHVGRFLFGLANEERARELEAAFGCRVCREVRQELLLAARSTARDWPSSSRADTRELLHCLYESQDGALVREALEPVTELALHLQSERDLVHAAYCLGHSRALRRLSLQVEKGIFAEKDRFQEPGTSQEDHLALCCWMELCSVLSSNKDLTLLEVSQSFLSHSSVRILCEQITRVTCALQKVVIKNVHPVNAYRDFCLALVGKETLTHLVLEGGIHCDHMLLLLLCEALRHRKCKLQYLRLGSCFDFTQQLNDFSLALEVNQSLQSLDLTASKLGDEGIKLLCGSLRHPNCFLQWLSLENCHLTEVCCKELASTLIVNPRLTHLCLARNNLGDSGVRLLCEGLSYPECQLQALVLCQCSITRSGCKHISDFLQGDSSLTLLDLSLNPIATGLWFLCEALKKPGCNLKCLGLCGCSLPSFCWQDLASALASNQRLEVLDLGQNAMGPSGITVLFETLKQRSSPLKRLRLRADESSAQTQKLLKEVRDCNPKLNIDCKAARAASSFCCESLFFMPRDNFPAIY